MTKFLKKTESETLNKIKTETLSPQEVKSLLAKYVSEHLPKTLDTGENAADVEKERKHREALVERKSNGGALKAIKQIEALAGKDEDFTQDDVKEAIALLSEIGRHIRHERKIHAAYLGANFFGLGAIALTILSIGTYTPFLCLSGMVAVRLGTQIYQDKTKSR